MRAVPLKTLRSRIGTVTQDPVLFDGDLRYNLFLDAERTDAEIHEVLQQVTLVSSAEEAALALRVTVDENLSAGQRQLLMLARALLRKSRIMVRHATPRHATRRRRRRRHTTPHAVRQVTRQAL